MTVVQALDGRSARQRELRDRLALIERFHQLCQALETWDTEAIIEMHGTNEYAVGFGTAAGELVRGRATLELMLDQQVSDFPSIMMRTGWIQAEVNGSTGWVMGEGSQRVVHVDGSEEDLPTRFTVVWTRGADRQWMIAHSHFSTPSPAASSTSAAAPTNS